MRKYLGIDIGGTRIKGTVVDKKFKIISDEFPIQKVKSPLHANATLNDLIVV